MDKEGKFWTAIVVLALLNIFTLVYVFQSAGSTSASLSYLQNRTASIDSSLSSYMSRQDAANSELKSTITDAQAASDRKITSVSSRLDAANAHIQALTSALEAIDAESAAKYESLSGKITGLENLSKGLDVEAIKNAVVIVKINNNIAGSGTIVSSDGYMLTSDHVVANMGDEDIVRIELYDGSKLRADVITRNTGEDLALLKITGRFDVLTYLTFEDVRNIKTGDKVYAIGNPLGEDLTKFTVTEGIISGFRQEGGVDLIQTDAALNPGNSGGPIVNNAGKVVGIVSMGYIDAQGLSFGIRSDVAQKFLNKEMP
jgi:S1-C subfamily serine protease